MIRLALPRCHQVVAATTIAAPRKARPRPSRRCSGSRSRALRPSARAPAPAAWASSIHTPETARATQPMKIMIGSVCGADRRFERPRPRLDPPRVFLPLPEPLRVDPRPGERLRTAVPPWDRAAPLGTRVAMMTTVTRITWRPKQRGARVAIPAAGARHRVRFRARLTGTVPTGWPPRGGGRGGERQWAVAWQG